MQRSSDSDELIAVGKITRTVGLEGFCFVEPSGFTLETLELPCKVSVGVLENDSFEIVLEEIDFRPKNLICRFEGVNDIETAESFKGKTIFVKKCELPSLEQDEFYHFELIGMAVYTDKNSESIGIICDVHNFPSADTVEVKRLHGETLLIPLTGESIISIEKESRRIIFRHSFVEELL
jgi:16S rRNA processing protein RimM